VRRRALFGAGLAPEADVRPTLLGIVTLLFLLLFFLLSTSTGQRLGVVDLEASKVALATLPHSGLVRSVRVLVDGAALTVVADVQTTDIAAAAESTERRTIGIPAVEGRADLRSLGQALGELHELDPSQEELTIVPSAATEVQTLLGVMDTARGTGSGAALFPRLSIGEAP
jgi:biopolymer transport protein ExbD